MMLERAGLRQRANRPAQRHRRGVAGHEVATAAVLGRDLVDLRGERLLGCLGPRRVRVLGVDADGVDRAVGPDAAGQLADRVDRVVGREVDRLRAGARAMSSRSRCWSTHKIRPAPINRALMTLKMPTGPAPNTATVSPSPTSASAAPNQPVGKMSESRIACSSETSSGRRTRPVCGVRDAGALGLQPVEAARLLGPAEERGARCVRVRAIALGVVARAAVRAGAAGDRRADHDAIARVEVAHAFAELLDDAHAFVTEDAAGLHAGHRAADEVQVGAADGARRQADDGVLGALQLGFGHVVEADVPDAVEDDGFHARGPTHPPPGRQSPDVSDSTARRGSAGAARCPGGSGVTRASGRCRGARRSRVARGLL